MYTDLLAILVQISHLNIVHRGVTDILNRNRSTLILTTVKLRLTPTHVWQRQFGRTARLAKECRETICTTDLGDHNDRSALARDRRCTGETLRHTSGAAAIEALLATSRDVPLLGQTIRVGDCHSSSLAGACVLNSIGCRLAAKTTKRRCHVHRVGCSRIGHAFKCTHADIIRLQLQDRADDVGVSLCACALCRNDSRTVKRCTQVRNLTCIIILGCANRNVGFRHCVGRSRLTNTEEAHRNIDSGISSILDGKLAVGVKDALEHRRQQNLWAALREAIGHRAVTHDATGWLRQLHQRGNDGLARTENRGTEEVGRQRLTAGQATHCQRCASIRRKITGDNHSGGRLLIIKAERYNGIRVADILIRNGRLELRLIAGLRRGQTNGQQQ